MQPVKNDITLEDESSMARSYLVLNLLANLLDFSNRLTTQYNFKTYRIWGTWMEQLIKHPALVFGSGPGLRVLISGS